MKTRQGFVSNSSSSSFIIQKKDLTVEQYASIKNHIEVAKGMSSDAMQYASDGDAWNIHEDKDTLRGDTFMDNFSMYEFMTEIGVPEKAMNFDGENY